MKQERDKEKELFDQEMNSLQNNFKGSYDLIAKKGENATRVAEEMALRNDELHRFNDRLKKFYEDKLKDINQEYLGKFKYLKDKATSQNRENSRLKEETVYWREIFKS